MIAAVVAALLAGIAIGAVVTQRAEIRRGIAVADAAAARLRAERDRHARTVRECLDAARWWQARWQQTERLRQAETARADRAVAALREDVRQP